MMAVTCLCESVNGSDHDFVLCNSTTFNFTGNESGHCHLQTMDEVLFRLLGPRQSSFFFPITFTYILIFITGVLGNLLTCTVITKDRKMRTPTNLYLFSLAISDLLVLIFGMPLEIYELWQNYPFPFGESICCFKIFLFETVCFASVLNVTVLSVERYIAVIHPLKTRYAITNKHAQRVIASVWALSLICAIPNTSLHGLQYQYLPEKVLESATCNLLKPKWMYNLVIQVTTVLFYFIPMMMISVLYLMIGLTLGRGQKQRKGKLEKNQESWKIHLDSRQRRQVTKMHCEWWPYPLHMSLLYMINDYLHIFLLLLLLIYLCIHLSFKNNEEDPTMLQAVFLIYFTLFPVN